MRVVKSKVSLQGLCYFIISILKSGVQIAEEQFFKSQRLLRLFHIQGSHQIV